MAPPQETEYSPAIIKHPFTDCGMVVLPNSNQEPETSNILESESALARWREMIGRQVKQAKSAVEISHLAIKSYTFRLAHPKLPFFYDKLSLGK